MNKKISIIYVGSIDKNKNIISTIKSINKLRDEGFDVNMIAIGAIKDKTIWGKLSKCAFIQDIGSLSKEELLPYYRQCDIFVMPSKHETFGLVYAEAMSQGLPVVYTRGQGFDKQFEDGEVGYAVNCDSIHEIVSAIKKIDYDYDRMSQNCINLVGKFDWKTISKQYKELYETIASE